MIARLRLAAALPCAVATAGFALALLTYLAVHVESGLKVLNDLALGLFVAVLPLALVALVVRFALVCIDNRCGPWALLARTYSRPDTAPMRITVKAAPAWLNNAVMVAGLYAAIIFGFFVWRIFPNGKPTALDQASLLSAFSAVFYLVIVLLLFPYASSSTAMSRAAAISSP